VMIVAGMLRGAGVAGFELGLLAVQIVEEGACALGGLLEADALLIDDHAELLDLLLQGGGVVTGREPVVKIRVHAGR
jgi:hypothetical protein